MDEQIGLTQKVAQAILHKQALTQLLREKQTQIGIAQRLQNILVLYPTLLQSIPVQKQLFQCAETLMQMISKWSEAIWLELQEICPTDAGIRESGVSSTEIKSTSTNERLGHSHIYLYLLMQQILSLRSSFTSKQQIRLNQYSQELAKHPIDFNSIALQLRTQFLEYDPFAHMKLASFRIPGLKQSQLHASSAKPSTAAASSTSTTKSSEEDIPFTFLPRTTCTNCGRTQPFYCTYCYVVIHEKAKGKLPVVELPITIDIILHPNVLRHKSTALQALLVVQPKAHLNVYTYPTIPSYDATTTAVIFPSDSALTIEQLTQQFSSRSTSSLADQPSPITTTSTRLTSLQRVVMLEGTWSEAHHMLAHAHLTNLIHLRLDMTVSSSSDSPQTAFWRYQKFGSGFLSTIEAIYYFMKQYQPYQQLLTPTITHNKSHPTLPSSAISPVQSVADAHSYDNLLWLFALSYSRVRHYYEQHQHLLPPIMNQDEPTSNFNHDEPISGDSRKKSIKPQTGSPLLTVPPSVDLISEAVPAPPLVGIEPNPGPDSQLNPAPAAVSVSASITSQTIFKDGLSHIYSFLSTIKWAHAYQTCRHWYSVAINGRSRDCPFPVIYSGDVILLPPRQMVHHFTWLYHQPKPMDSFYCASHFVTLIHALPQLTRIVGHFNELSLDDVLPNWSRTKINWPQSLTSLTLTCFPVHTLIGLVQSLKCVPSLTFLTLFSSGWSGYGSWELEEFMSSVVLSTPPTDPDSSTTISTNQPQFFLYRPTWSSLLSQLSELNVFGGSQFRRMIPHQTTWPKLQRLDLSKVYLHSGDLALIYQCVPNLVELAPAEFCEEDFGLVVRFQSLQTIRVSFNFFRSHQLESMVTATLIQCPNLTNLQFDCYMLLKPQSWFDLSASHLVRNLVHLQIRWARSNCLFGFEPIELDQVVGQFSGLRSLSIDLGHNVELHQVKARFSSVSVLPQLRRLELIRDGRATEFEWDIDLGLNVDTYRLQPTQSTLDESPAARLVGVELNPGPSGLSAQTLFKDGINSIMLFLSTYEWLLCIRTCRYWYEIAQTVSSRQVLLDQMNVRRFSAVCLKSKLLFHIGTIKTANGRYLPFDLLSALMTRCTQLCSIKMIVYDGKQGLLKRPIHLTPTLRHLEIDFSPINSDAPIPPSHNVAQSVLNALVMVPHLQSMKLSGLPLVDLSPLQHLPELSQLTLEFDYSVSRCRWNQPQSIHQLLTSLVQSLPLSCTDLTLLGGSGFNLTELNILRLPQLRLFDLSRTSHREEILTQIHQSLPNLIQLASCTNEPAFTPLYARFKSLTSISFGTIRPHSPIVKSLAECSSLTHLGFHVWCLRKPVAYETIIERTQLTSLTLNEIEQLDDLLLTLASSPIIAARMKTFNIEAGEFDCQRMKTNLAHFIECTSLTLLARSDSYGPVMDMRMEFCDSNFMPALEQLTVRHWGRAPHYLYPIELIWNRTTGNVQQVVDRFEEDKVPISVVQEFRRKKSTPEVTEISLEQSPPKLDSPPSTKDVPSPRLVGIESNPGPSRSYTPHPSISQLTSTLNGAVCCSPQKLFKDGLYLIFSYLPQSDWLTTFRVCHDWSNSAASSPSRRLSFPIGAKGAMIHQPPQRLLRHFTSFFGVRQTRKTENRDAMIGVASALLSTITQQLPFLSRIRFTRVSSKAKSKVLTPPPLMRWPTSLNELTIDFQSCCDRTLIASIFTCSTLIKLQLLRISAEEDLTVFQPLAQLIHCESLTLLCDGLWNGSRDLLTEMKLSQLPLHLKSFDLCGGSQRGLDLRTLTRMKPLVELEEISLFDRKVDEGEVDLLHQVAPHLTTLQISTSYPSNFSVLPKFHSLHTFHLDTPLSFRHAGFPDEYESLLIQRLISCSQLTSLQFINWSPLQPTSWVSLSQSLHNLILLKLTNTCPLSLDLLHSFHQLRSLTFRNQPESMYSDLHAYFASSSIMSGLNVLNLHSSYWLRFMWEANVTRKDNYRLPITRPDPYLSTSASPLATKDVPADRLVGIELNPGPGGPPKPSPNQHAFLVGLELNLRPTTHSSTFSTLPVENLSTPSAPKKKVLMGKFSRGQTLFKDGLHLIFSFLPNRDFFASIKTCGFWLNASITSQKRELTISIQPNGYLAVPVNYRFISWITKLDSFYLDRQSRKQFLEQRRALNSSGVKSKSKSPTKSHPFPLIRLFDGVQRLPGLTTIPYFNIPIDAVDLPPQLPDQHILWPSSLTSVEINFRGRPYPHLLNCITRAVSLTELRLYHPMCEIGSQLSQLIQLQKLTIDFGGWLQPEEEYATTVNKWAITALPPNMTYFNFIEGVHGHFLDLFLSPSLSLVEINLKKFFLHQPIQLTRLLSIAPNLSQCVLPIPHQPHLMPNWTTLTQFHQLTSLTFDFCYGHSFYDDAPTLATAMLNTLTQCVSLTHIGFRNCECLRKPTDWLLLTQHLTSLISVEIYKPEKDLTYLQPLYSQLKKLRLSVYSLPSDLAESCLKFESLEELFIVLDGETRERNQIKSFFNDATRLQTLNYFHLEYPFYEPQEQTPITKHFIWDKKNGINVSAYRLPIQKSDHSIHPHHTNLSIPDSSSASNTHETVPVEPVPPPRLVGIELNPGPFTIASISYPIVQITPATMFKDGLHLISSYLNKYDWASTLQVCHHWADSFSSSTSRGLSYPIEPDGTFRSLPSISLRHHFTHFKDRSPFTFTVNQLLSIGREFPFITNLSLELRPDPTAAFPTADPTANAAAVIAPVCTTWPCRLKELSIDLKGWHSSNLIHAISSCINLESLLLLQMSHQADFSLFRSYHQLIHLKAFALTVTFGKRLDLLAAMGWNEGNGGPPNVRDLNICDGIPTYFSLTTFSQIHWLNLDEVILPTNLQPGDLSLTLLGAPNINEMDLYSTPLCELEMLQEFKSLQLVRIRPPIWDQNEQYESGMIPAFCQCLHLTSLDFHKWSPQLSSSWLQLSCLSRLSYICFDGCHPAVLDDLLPLKALEILVFLEVEKEMSKYVRDYFRSPLVMPQLCQIEVSDSGDQTDDWLWAIDGTNNTDRGDQFRLQHQQPTNQTTMTASTPTTAPPPADVPDALLVGIESNPGPIDVTTTNSPASIIAGPTPTLPVIIRITPATMFKDGLHLISSYLNQHDWVSALQVSHHWAESFSSSASRRFSYPIEPDGTFRSLPSISIRHHFTQFKGRYTCTTNQLLAIGREFPSITLLLSLKIRADPDEAITPVTPPQCIWPIGLRGMEIALEGLKSPYLIRAISSCISLVRLALMRVSEHEDFAMFRSYDQLIHLESFSLLNMRTRDRLQGFDLLAAMKWHETGGPPNLRRLNIASGDPSFFSFETFSQLRLNKAASITLPPVLKAGDLTLLLRGAPNLSRISVESCPLVELTMLKEFKSLHTLCFESYAHDDSHEQSESDMIQAISECVSLTTLVFGYWKRVLQAPDSWIKLTRLTRLVEITFNRGCRPSHLDVLLPLQTLRRLVFSSASQNVSDYVREFFRSPLVMPRLCHIEINYSGNQSDWIWLKDGTSNTDRGDQFRQQPVSTTNSTMTATTATLSTPATPQAPLHALTVEEIEPIPEFPPAVPLVGVESNPGPQSDISSIFKSSWSPSDMGAFTVAWIGLVTDLLPIQEWKSIRSTCRSWKLCVDHWRQQRIQTIPARMIPRSLDENRRGHLFQRVQCAKVGDFDHPIDLEQFQLLSSLPHLQSLECDLTTIQPPTTDLPQHRYQFPQLHSLRINLLAPYYLTNLPRVQDELILFERDVVHFIECFNHLTTTLRSFHLKVYPDSSLTNWARTSGFPFAIVLQPLLPLAQTLTTLILDCSVSCPQRIDGQLLAHFTNLTYCDIRTRPGDLGQFLFQPNLFPSLLFAPFITDRSIQAYGFSNERYEYEYRAPKYLNYLPTQLRQFQPPFIIGFIHLTFLGRLTNLRQLRLHNDSRVDIKELFQVAPAALSRLELIDLSHRWFTTQDLVRLFNSLPSLTDIRLTAMQSMNSLKWMDSQQLTNNLLHLSMSDDSGLVAMDEYHHIFRLTNLISLELKSCWKLNEEFYQSFQPTTTQRINHNLPHLHHSQIDRSFVHDPIHNTRQLFRRLALLSYQLHVKMMNHIARDHGDSSPLAIAPVPADRLVGIELNPGPFEPGPIESLKQSSIDSTISIPLFARIVRMGYVWLVTAVATFLLALFISRFGLQPIIQQDESCPPISIRVDPSLPSMSEAEFKTFEQLYQNLEEFTTRAYVNLERVENDAEAVAAVKSDLSDEISRWSECSNTDSTCSRCSMPPCTRWTRHVPIPSNIPYGNLTRSCRVHGFVLAVHEAYRRHLPFTIRVEDIWTMILQGFAMHLQHAPEEVRVRWEEQWRIPTAPIHSPRILPLNRIDEEMMLERLISFQRELTSDSTSARSILLRPFSASTLLQEISFGAPLLSLSPLRPLLPNYQGHHQCGIPIIRLGGSHSDWIDLFDRMRSLHLGELDPQLRYWEAGLTWILSSMIESFENGMDGTNSYAASNFPPSITTFWLNMYQVRERLDQLEYWGYRGDQAIEFDGWLTFFFPYLHTFEWMDSIGWPIVNHNIIRQGDDYHSRRGGMHFESSIFQACSTLFAGGRLSSEDITHKCFATVALDELPTGLSQIPLQLNTPGVDQDSRQLAVNGTFYVGFGDPRISYELCAQPTPAPSFPFNLFTHHPWSGQDLSGVYSSLVWGMKGP